ncbi:hypothetical protein [Nocardia terpenica]|uniref:Uncharacterized protein n=1 Tax=Nocardia terpenica TaxID=455432 RepID=A0A6G9ZAB8_9NOCA|nr:hypothetical protein [Nocardia terpenica]QIS22307.1 hypothetical protein F6W96_32165 [Nocardia terpenica]
MAIVGTAVQWPGGGIPHPWLALPLFVLASIAAMAVGWRLAGSVVAAAATWLAARQAPGAMTHRGCRSRNHN